jgi:hypothetical protein
MKRKRLYFTLFVTLLFQVGMLLLVYKSNWLMDYQLILNVKASPGATCQIYINGKENPLNNRSTDRQGETWMVSLPKTRINRIWLNTPPPSGSIEINKVKIKSLLREFEFKGKSIRTLFLIDKNVIDPGSTFEFNKRFVRMINDALGDKTTFYLITPLATLLFFCFFHFFNPKGILFFFRARVVNDVTLLFLIIIFFFFLDHIFLITKRTHLMEKRKIAEKPSFRFDSISSFPQQYTSYFKDFFPLRSTFIYLNNLIKVRCFGISPTPKVILGKQSWLYMGRESDKIDVAAYFRQLKSFSKEELEQWKSLLQKRQKWLAKRNILYLFIPVPNKSTIYPEFMPDHIQPMGSQSLLDQLVGYLKTHSTVPVLDLRDALVAAKKVHPVYSKTDTHWNDFGAYIAYREIIGYISSRFKEVMPIPLSRFKIIPKNRSGGDLAIMLSLHKEVMREDMVFLTAHPSLTAAGIGMKNISKYIKQGTTECTEGAPLKLLMVHDSFYKKLKPYLSEQFVKVHYIWDWKMNFYSNIILREKPMIVIDQMAERFLMGDIPKNPQLLWSD